MCYSLFNVDLYDVQIIILIIGSFVILEYIYKQ